MLCPTASPSASVAGIKQPELFIRISSSLNKYARLYSSTWRDRSNDTMPFKPRGRTGVEF